MAVLDGGLRLIAIPMPAVHRTVAQVVVRIGSRFETLANNGISHLLEHMLFRGTARFPSAHDLALAFERYGASLEAATAVDHGMLVLSAPPASFDQVVPWLGEVVRAPLLEGLEVERGIVREEILELLDEEGRLVDASSLVRARCFAGHPLGYPITGSIEQLEHFTQSQLADYHRSHYTSSGTVIAVAGPLDAGRVLARLAECFQDLPRGTPPNPLPPEEPPASRFTFVEHPSSQTALALAFRAPGERDPNEAATELLLRLLDDGMSTRLYHRICDERGLCYDVSAVYEAYADSGLFELAAETSHDNAVEVLRELLGIVRGLRREGPLPEELEKAQARHGWQLGDLLDDPGAIAEFYALGELSGVARTPEDRLAELGRVTRDDLRRAAEQMIRPDQMTVVAVGTVPRRVQDALAALVQEF
jgi:predicted Zn-dependent peptidase